MSVDDQHEYYEGSDEIASVPFGLISRDNRNHRKKAETILDESDATPGDSILEVGCGHGLHAKIYAKEYDYTGVDISESLAAETRYAIPEGDAFAANALDLPFDANEFDAVFGGAILHHLPDQARALEEWCRVVKPGGDVVLMEPNYLFPKDLVTAHLVPEEQHKTMMAPWRVRRLLEDCPGEGTVTPRIYTPPLPAALHGAFDAIDAMASNVPGVRWASQMLLIQINVTG